MKTNQSFLWILLLILLLSSCTAAVPVTPSATSTSTKIACQPIVNLVGNKIYEAAWSTDSRSLYFHFGSSPEWQKYESEGKTISPIEAPHDIVLPNKKSGFVQEFVNKHDIKISDIWESSDHQTAIFSIPKNIVPGVPYFDPVTGRQGEGDAGIWESNVYLLPKRYGQAIYIGKVPDFVHNVVWNPARPEAFISTALLFHSETWLINLRTRLIEKFGEINDRKQPVIIGFSPGGKFMYYIDQDDRRAVWIHNQITGSDIELPDSGGLEWVSENRLIFIKNLDFPGFVISEFDFETNSVRDLTNRIDFYGLEKIYFSPDYSKVAVIDNNSFKGYVIDLCR